MKNILLLLALIVTGLGSSQDLLMQNGTFNQCSGLFYDSGGEFGNYGNNENLVTTICSDVAGDFVQLNFTQFVTQGGAQADTMYIYDGDDTTAALIGSYTLTNSPGVVSASESNTSGCLTIEFVSSPSGNAQGWIAEIECFTPCQTITASIDDTTPAAVAGVIEVDPGDIVTFNGSATFSEDGTGAEYSWDFGNGASMAGQTVNYAYPNPGTYIVTLTVSDDNPLGCFASSNTIEVKVLDNDMCSGALPICGDIEDVPSPVGAGDAENGINYGCLSSVPNPRWYFMQTGPEAGTLNFTLSQNTGQNGTGSGLDIDFILWGPFDEPVCGPANLNPTNQVDCSYSADSVEQIDIPNAPANSYYVLLITNYSGNAGYINLQMNPVPGSNATTNCDIICQVDLGDDQQICNGGSYTIEAEFTGAFNTFEWQLDGETIPGETGSTLTVTESGTYKLIAEGFDAVFGDPCTAENEVVVTIADSIALNDLTISTCSASTTNADFDLDAEIVNILSPLDAADYSVTFHNSLADAEADAPSITGTDSYNGTDGEVIHVRVEANGTDCFAVSTITLGISPQPALNPAPDMELCDDNSNDGFESFDLSAQTA
ncbi:PKD domain-containing protein, partial [Winogradskyella epiphytica]